MPTRRAQRTYDHRLIRLVQETRDATIATRLGIPRSTAAGWIRRAGYLRRLVAFYVEEHNARVPHAAFEGQTPDEMYFATGGHVPGQLAVARAEARRRRLEVHRAARCGVCVVGRR